MHFSCYFIILNVLPILSLLQITCFLLGP